VLPGRPATVKLQQRGGQDICPATDRHQVFSLSALNVRSGLKWVSPSGKAVLLKEQG
jgi:hypothetical protein